MSADKRTVTTDALETLGTILTEREKRDAIHLAVDNVVAAQTLKPGDDVGFVPGGVGICDNPVGIVDPFLKQFVKKGERFWLVVYPRQITSLRHVWSHPAFDEEKPAATKTSAQRASEEWLQSYAMTLGCDYEELIEHAKAYVETGQYWCEGDRFEGVYTGDEFWEHYSIVTGNTVPTSSRFSFFSCSC